MKYFLNGQCKKFHNEQNIKIVSKDNFKSNALQGHLGAWGRWINQ